MFPFNIIDMDCMFMMSAVHGSVSMLLSPNVEIISAIQSHIVTSFDDSLAEIRLVFTLILFSALEQLTDSSPPQSVSVSS